MKLKNILIILVVLVMIPEILLLGYLFSKYKIETPQIPEFYATDFFTFLISNPLFIILIIVVIIVMIILYFALQY